MKGKCDRCGQIVMFRERVKRGRSQTHGYEENGLDHDIACPRSPKYDRRRARGEEVAPAASSSFLNRTWARLVEHLE